MNIPSRFDLYIENKLSNADKYQFERELSEQPALAESYKAYTQINRILKNELYSPILDYDDDPILKELSLSQRITIEEDFIRFYSREIECKDENQLLFECKGITDQNTYEHQAGFKKTSDGEEGEQQFLRILNNTAKLKSSGNSKITRLYIGIAAAFVLTFFAGNIIAHHFSGNRMISPKNAFASYYNPKTDNELRSLKFRDSRLSTAFIDFKRSGIGLSTIFLNQLNVSDEDFELSLLYLGIIYLERNNSPEAIKCFTRILSLKSPKKVDIANFYLSLAYLSEDNYSNAKPLLKNLSETRNPYRKISIAILKRVKPL